MRTIDYEQCSHRVVDRQFTQQGADLGHRMFFVELSKGCCIFRFST